MHLGDLYLNYRVLYPLYSELSLLRSVLREAKKGSSEERVNAERLAAVVYSVASSS